MKLNLWISMDLSTSWARETEPNDGAACPAANWIAARVVMSHRRDEIDAKADREMSAATSPAPESDHAAASQAAAELVARPGQSAADRAGGAPERCAASSSVSPSK